MTIRKRTAMSWLLVASVLGFFYWAVSPSEHPERYPPPRVRPSVYKHTPEIPKNVVVPPKRANASAPDGWRLFKPALNFLATISPVAPTVAEQLPCLEQWIAYGKPCSAREIPVQLDVLWTWVNGSEPILSATRDKEVAIAMEAKKQPGFQPGFLGSRKTHFRTHEEMVHSMRSVLNSLPPELVRRYILITADVSADDTEELRFGSVPTWLDLDSNVQVAHHSDIYRVPESLLSPDDPLGRRWRDRIVPSFNSLAIESQLVHMRDVAPTIFYSNDDCFLMRPLSAADFETPLYGPVFRIQFDLAVKSRPPDSPPVGVDKEGEWPGLHYTNWLLDQRFGKRSRRYLHHVAKVISTPIMREVGAIWSHEIARTAEARFRGHGPQVNLLYLTTWYTIEKHREMLLYSFIMLRVDANADGLISADERLTLTAGLDLDSGQVAIAMRENGSPHYVAHNFKAAGLDEPKETQYTWLSSDGYPLIETKQTKTQSQTTAKATHCQIDIRRCFDFASESVSSLDLFRRVAFEQPGCGDCLIAHVVGRSGKDGLSAFLPRLSTESQRHPLPQDFAKRWQDAQFPTGLGRGFAVNAIQRYSYVFGTSPMEFLAIRRIGDVKKFPDLNSKVAFFAVNDDMYNPSMLEQLDADMRRWYAQRWGAIRGWWEK
ncbi:hypothetical protein C8F01DRAFT_1115840 [Mycena amicta]|nr:hypothetical protein C8F01DRAFT_1115840 [Mycena amicta]